MSDVVVYWQLLNRYITLRTLGLHSFFTTLLWRRPLPFWRMAPLVGAIETVSAGLKSAKEAVNAPWFAFLPLTALSLRLSLLPLSVKQLQAVATTSWAMRQVSKKPIQGLRVAHKCARTPSVVPRGASPWWVLAAPAAQVPTFLGVTLGVRRLAQEQAAGMTDEGILWFPDLTQPALDMSHGLAEATAPMGPAGVAIPLATAMVHVSAASGLRTSATGPADAIRKAVLDFLALPAFFGGLVLPHAVPLYWLSGASLSCLQSWLLRREAVRQRLLPSFPRIKPGSS